MLTSSVGWMEHNYITGIPKMYVNFRRNNTIEPTTLIYIYIYIPKVLRCTLYLELKEITFCKIFKFDNRKIFEAYVLLSSVLDVCASNGKCNSWCLRMQWLSLVRLGLSQSRLQVTQGGLVNIFTINLFF